MQRVLYEQQQFPIFQNRMYESAQAARGCTRGDIRLVEDMRSGLVYNAAFEPALMQYDDHYQNEQAVSGLFQRHLEDVAAVVERTLGREQLVEGLWQGTLPRHPFLPRPRPRVGVFA